MKIGIISDTHDHLNNIDKAFEVLKKESVDMVCHLGDWIAPYAVDQVVKKTKELGVPLKGVLGNNDGEIFFITSKNPVEWEMELGHETLTIEIDNRKIILYHGTDSNLTQGLIEGAAFDAVLSGHTHEPRNELIGKTLALNPGTLSGYSYSRGGKIQKGELAVYDTKTNKAQLRSFSISSI